MRLALSRTDLLLLAVLTLVWGVNWPVMKLGVQDFPALSFRTICMVGGLVLLGAVARLQGLSLKIRREHWRELILLGLTNLVIWYVMSIYAIRMLSSGRAAILAYTMPVWVALIGRAFYGDRLSGRQLLGVLSACGAIGLLLAEESGAIAGRPAGALLMIGAALVWATGTQWMRRRKIDVPLVVLTFWMMVQALVVCVPLCWLLEREQWVRAPNTVEWAAIVYNIFLVFGVGQLLWFRLGTLLPPVVSSLSVMLIPVVGVFSGMAMLGETPGWPDLAALVCVLMSIGTVLLPARRLRT
jgi:drug/metabolite transporter (DMT)-like permease